jgi:hypothetical protein
MVPPVAKPSVVALVWGTTGVASWATAVAAPKLMATPGTASVRVAASVAVRSPSASAVAVIPATKVLVFADIAATSRFETRP